MERVRGFFNGVMAGVMISVGGAVLLSVDSKYIGAFAFATGLFLIIVHKFWLFTGMVCDLPNQKPKYIIDLALSLAGNLVGTFVFAKLVSATILFGLDGRGLSDNAYGIMVRKLDDTLLSAFILAVLCGLMVYLAVYTYRLCAENNNPFGGTLGVFLCIGIFILSGYNHCVADMFYLFASGITAKNYHNIFNSIYDPPSLRINPAPYIAIVTLGNSVGGMLIPFLKKVKLLPGDEKKL